MMMRFLVGMLLVLGGCPGLITNRGAPETKTIVVRDEAGKPLPGALVYAFELWAAHHWAEPSAHKRVHGPLRTNAQGLVHTRIGEGSRFFYIATYPGWPSQTAKLGTPSVIVLGPPRTLSGKIVLPASCPPGVLSVTAIANEQLQEDWVATDRAVRPVAASIVVDQFTLRGLGPPPYRVALRACGRVSSVLFTGWGQSWGDLRLTLDVSVPEGSPKTPTASARFRPIYLVEKGRSGEGVLLEPNELTRLERAAVDVRDEQVPAKSRTVDRWVQDRLKGAQRTLVSADGRFAAGVYYRDHGGNLVLLDVDRQKAMPVPKRVNEMSLRFVGPWLLAVEVTQLAPAVGDGFAVHAETGEVQQLAMGIASHPHVVEVRGDLIVQQESSGRVIASRLGSPDVIALGVLHRFEVGTDGQWLVGYDDAQRVQVVRTNGSAKLVLGPGTPKFTTDGRRLLFKHAHSPDRGPLELIDLDEEWRVRLAEGVLGFTSLPDGRIVYSKRGRTGTDTYIQTP